jgi:hypothetical protein
VFSALNPFESCLQHATQVLWNGSGRKQARSHRELAAQHGFFVAEGFETIDTMGVAYA